MNTALRASLLVNLLLVLALLCFFEYSRRQPIQGANESTTHLHEEASVSTPGGTASGQAPFRWRQLESTDYREYVANLRGIGCPEQTIRDIITADVASLYAARRDQLRRVFGNSAHAGSETSERVRGALERLNQEQAAVLLALLGNEAGSPSGLGQATAPRFARGSSDVIAMPLALQNVDLAGLHLGPRQQAAILDVRERFQAKIQAAGLPPADPSYRALWQKAQAESDDLLQALLGGECYIDYQLAARSAAVAVCSPHSD